VPHLHMLVQMTSIAELCQGFSAVQDCCCQPIRRLHRPVPVRELLVAFCGGCVDGWNTVATSSVSLPWGTDS